MNPPFEPHSFLLASFYLSDGDPETAKGAGLILLKALGEGALKYDIPPNPKIKNNLYKIVANYQKGDIHLRWASLFGRNLFHLIFGLKEENPQGAYRMTLAKLSGLSHDLKKNFPRQLMGNSLLFSLFHPGNLKEKEELALGITEEQSTCCSLTVFGELFRAGDIREKTHRFILFKPSARAPILDAVTTFFPLIDMPTHRVHQLLEDNGNLNNQLLELTKPLELRINDFQALMERPSDLYPGDRLKEIVELLEATEGFDGLLHRADHLGEWLGTDLKIFQQVGPIVLKGEPGEEKIFTLKFNRLQKLHDSLRETLEPTRQLFQRARDMLYCWLLSEDLTPETVILTLCQQMRADPSPEKRLYEKLLVGLKEGLGISDQKMEVIAPLLQRLPAMPCKMAGPEPLAEKFFRFLLVSAAGKSRAREREIKVLDKVGDILGFDPPARERIIESLGLREAYRRIGPDSVKPPPAVYAGSSVKILDEKSMFNVAINEYRQSHFDIAKEFLKLFLMSHPDNELGLLLLARCYHRLGQGDRGARLLGELPHSLEGKFLASLFQLDKGDYDGFEPIQLQGGEFDIDELARYGHLLSKKGHDKSAETVYHQILTPTLLARRFPPRYHDITRLGDGGMGIVYSARDTVLDIELALKLVRPQYAFNQELLDTLLKEARIMAILNSHSNTVHVYDIETKGIPYIVMDKVHGGSLRHHLDRHRPPLPLKIIKKIARQILETLVYAHEEPKLRLIHRDLKPENILLESIDRVFINDFGLAEFEKDMEINERPTGTPAYMAPEQFKGAAIDFTADIYSVGLMIYEMATGVLPFAPAYFKKVILEPESPVTHNPKLPAIWEKVILTAIARKTEARYPSARAFLDALGGLVE